MTRRANSPALQVEQLEDRLNPAGSMIPAGEFNWMQYSPTGELAQLVWMGSALVYRDRVAGAWVDTTITTNTTFTQADYSSRDQVETASRTAQLVFTTDGTPHALVLDKQWNGIADGYQTLIHDYARTASGWQLAETITPSWLSQWGPNTLVAAAGPNNAIDLMFTETSAAATGVGNFGSGALYYATDASGTWAFSAIAQTADLNQDVWFTGGRWAPRYLSLAVDANNNAYVAYTPEFYIAGAFSTVDSTLMYATNAGGSWTSQVVQAPANGPADAGLGASIAVSPTGQVGIASYYVQRYSTGSPLYSELLYHTLVNGQWTSTVVANTPDGYVAGDGPKFTGFAPELSFDSSGNPMIVFSDEAGQHLPVSYANEFAGQIRVASFNGSTWDLQTVLPQTNPIQNQLFYPVSATFNEQTTFAGLQAVSTVDANQNPISTDFALVDANAPSGLTSAPVSAVPSVPPPAAPVAPTPTAAAPIAPVAAAATRADSDLPTGYAVVKQTGTSATQVLVYRTDGSLAMSVTPFGDSYFGPVRIARGDINGDGVPDLITATGPGIQARFRVWDGQTGALLDDVEAFPGFMGGLWVAAGDLTRDGYADIAIGADQGLQPHVDVYDGKSMAIVASFWAYEPGFVGGVRVAMGDVNHDGYDDLVTAPGYGAGAHVTVFDGKSLGAGLGPVHLADFFMYDPGMISGITIAVGDLSGNGYADIIAGPSNGSSNLRVVSGYALMTAQQVVDISSIYAWPQNGAGVQVAVADVYGTGTPDVVVSPSTADNGQIGVFTPSALQSNNASAIQWIDPLPGLSTSVFVG
jgi:hypothetical protein